jgi:sulfide:quinone oxidoreductase
VTAHRARARVVLAGGGVAAVETLLALRQLAGRNVAVELIAPERDLLDRPSSVAIPFGFGTSEPLDLEALAARMDAGFRRATLAAVDPERSVALAPRSLRSRRPAVRTRSSSRC